MPNKGGRKERKKRGHFPSCQNIGKKSGKKKKQKGKKNITRFLTYVTYAWQRSYTVFPRQLSRSYNGHNRSHGLSGFKKRESTLKYVTSGRCFRHLHFADLHVAKFVAVFIAKKSNGIVHLAAKMKLSPEVCVATWHSKGNLHIL